MSRRSRMRILRQRRWAYFCRRWPSGRLDRCQRSVRSPIATPSLPWATPCPARPSLPGGRPTCSAFKTVRGPCHRSSRTRRGRHGTARAAVCRSPSSSAPTTPEWRAEVPCLTPSLPPSSRPAVLLPRARGRAPRERQAEQHRSPQRRCGRRSTTPGAKSVSPSRCRAPASTTTPPSLTPSSARYLRARPLTSATATCGRWRTWRCQTSPRTPGTSMSTDRPAPGKTLWE